jgi:ATP-binding cassette, subfamily C (CFTR/MRP), member 1
MSAAMNFFHVTPSGRILNRFSKDMDGLCESLPDAFFDALTNAVIVITGIAVCTLATPLYILFILPLSLPYIYLQKHYLSTSRALRRLHAVTRSPIYQLMGETLEGLSTIRAFKVEKVILFFNFCYFYCIEIHYTF